MDISSGSENIVPLTHLQSGQSGVVVGIGGGFGAGRRLENLGIRPGKKITRVGGGFLRGPVTVRVDHTQAGIGFGLASKVMVDLTNEKSPLDG